MRNQETINKVKEANSLEVSMTFCKSVFYSDSKTPMSEMKKAKAFDYLKGVNSASVKIQHTERVVKSTIKKIKALGFNVELVESEVLPWGSVNHWVIINK